MTVEILKLFLFYVVAPKRHRGAASFLAGVAP
jgi:hypothetical protein